jgi:ABC-type sugar transport system substrate-binding protein
MKIILFALLLLSTITPAYANDDEYAFILRARSNQYWEVMGQGIKDAATALGEYMF